MKVFFFTAGMTGGGTERVIAVLANYLANKRYEVEIVMTACDEVEYELDSRVRVHFLGGRTGGSLWKRVERAQKIRELFVRNPDAAFFSFGTETNCFALIAGMGINKNLVVSERNDPNQCTYQKFRNIIYRFADKIVFQTQEALECFPKKIAQKGVVIPNPISGQLPEMYEGKRRKEIVAVGRMQPQKNHKLLIDAFALFQKAHPEYQLIIYGKGELQEELQRQVQDLGIENNVLFPGFAQNVLERIRESTMYVLSSDYEGISNSLLEAMGIGLPVISTNCPIGGSAMLIESGVNGILVPMGEPKQLADAMTYIADDEDFAKALACRAKLVKDKYSADNICKKWEELL